MLNYYNFRMLDSLTNLNHIIQHCIYFLLYQKKVFHFYNYIYQDWIYILHSLAKESNLH